jgi:hypothetical protein
VVRNTGQAGVAVLTGAGAEVSTNTIRDAGTRGIVVRDAGTHGILTSNTIERAADTGIDVDEGGAAQVRDNTVRASGEVGIVVRDGATATVAANDVTGSPDGISFMGAGTRGAITDNELAQIANTSIGLTRGASADLTANTIRGGRMGIDASGTGTRGTISANTIRDVREFGIRIGVGADMSVTGNHVERSAAIGILVQAGADVTDNDVIGLGETAAAGSEPIGIRYQSRLAGTIRGNRVSAHLDPGVGVGCGLAITGGALAVELAGNRFPAPGNEVDLCDDRTPTATPVPAAMPTT